ncbi:MAG: pseudouridine synthase [Acidimicrobiales bacterium]
MSADALPGERLQKVLARAGYGSRRAADELVASGRVTVDGSVAVPGRRVDVNSEQVAVDGVVVGVLPSLVSYLLNKPAGVVSTAADPAGRRTVTSLVPTCPRVFPVGRLDAASEGLIVLTNDGDLAHHLAHPSHGVEKEYLAKVKGAVSPGAVRRLREGVELSDGITLPAKVSRVAPDLLRVTLKEGRNRQVRRMCEAVGHPVERLVRVRIGPVFDQGLAPGQWRRLSVGELRLLRHSVHVG